MKKCSNCQQTKSLTCFDRNKSYTDGYSYTCKDCRKTYRQQNKDLLADKQAKYRQQTNNYMCRYYQDKFFRETMRCRSAVSMGIRNQYTEKSQVTKWIGCSYTQLMTYIGERPDSTYELDHRCPISQAQSIEEVQKLQHYSNLRWLPKNENIAKYNQKTVSGVILCRNLLNRDWIN